jgi:cysteine-S-conjugate beta-lyase
MASDSKRPAARGLQTRLVQTGKNATAPGGRAVNPTLVRASTVLFENTAEQREMRARRGTERLFTYGARGTPTTFALEDAVSELEGAYRTRLFPSGLAAIGFTLLAYLKPGDHVLMSDGVYEPARALAESFLEPFGIRTTFFAADGSDLQQRWELGTRLVYVESPASLVYEMCDLPAIAAFAHTRGALVAADNTWGCGVFYRPLALGADISLTAATKYLSGHSDVMMGTVSTTKDVWQPLQQRCEAFGMTASPDDSWLVLRGMRSLSARLKMHEQHALQVAEWLLQCKEVRTVFCPALPSHPGHALWKRDCTGTNGLLSIELQPGTDAGSVDHFIDSLTLFGLGASWGGYESLVTGANMQRARSVTDWSTRGPVVRLHIGLEDPADLIADLGCALETL